MEITIVWLAPAYMFVGAEASHLIIIYSIPASFCSCSSTTSFCSLVGGSTVNQHVRVFVWPTWPNAWLKWEPTRFREGRTVHSNGWNGMKHYPQITFNLLHSSYYGHPPLVIWGILIVAKNVHALCLLTSSWMINWWELIDKCTKGIQNGWNEATFS